MTTRKEPPIRGQRYNRRGQVPRSTDAVIILFWAEFNRVHTAAWMPPSTICPLPTTLLTRCLPRQRQTGNAHHRHRPSAFSSGSASCDDSGSGAPPEVYPHLEIAYPLHASVHIRCDSVEQAAPPATALPQASRKWLRGILHTFLPRTLCPPEATHLTCLYPRVVGNRKEQHT